jgi:hypothetical protein
VEELQASLAAARGALGLAQGRVEELLDDKADLEYDVDVLERKLELLREEVGKGEGAVNEMTRGGGAGNNHQW